MAKGKKRQFETSDGEAIRFEGLPERMDLIPGFEELPSAAKFCWYELARVSRNVSYRTAPIRTFASLAGLTESELCAAVPELVKIGAVIPKTGSDYRVIPPLDKLKEALKSVSPARETPVSYPRAYESESEKEREKSPCRAPSHSPSSSPTIQAPPPAPADAAAPSAGESRRFSRDFQTGEEAFAYAEMLEAQGKPIGTTPRKPDPSPQPTPCTTETILGRN